MKYLDAIPHEEVKVEKKNGSIIGPFIASFGMSTITVYDEKADLDEGDIILRALPNGKVESRIIKEVNFFPASDAIPARYHIKYRKESLEGQKPTTKRITQSSQTKPWIAGPKELLDHAAEHLKLGNPFDHRIAMISIDNAVELAIRTYLGLPERSRGTSGPSRKELEGDSGFPNLLDLLEKYGEDRLTGVELGDLEWYHRLRNTLYHEGNGVTTDPANVDAYFQIASLLFQNLFTTTIEQPVELTASSLLGEFIVKWSTLETRLKVLALIHLPKYDGGFKSPVSYYDELIAHKIIPDTYRTKLKELTQTRNMAVHSTNLPSPNDLRQYLESLEAIIEQLPTVDDLIKIDFVENSNEEELKNDSQLEIIRAIYWSRNKKLDVTDELRQKVKDDMLITIADNDIAGDPDKGIGKKLTIVYKFNGITMTKEFVEHDSVVIP